MSTPSPKPFSAKMTCLERFRVAGTCFEIYIIMIKLYKFFVECHLSRRNSSLDVVIFNALCVVGININF
jgi:hypothetical protein